MKLFLVFCILNVLNVVIQTAKSIATIKCGKTVAAITNAVAYGLYTVVIVYTMCDLPLYIKAIVVAIANLIGVFIVKTFEEKKTKVKLWKVEATVKDYDIKKISNLLDNTNIGYSVLNINNGNYLLLMYCNTKDDSQAIKRILIKYRIKYIIVESRGAL